MPVVLFFVSALYHRSLLLLALPNLVVQVEVTLNPRSAMEAYPARATPAYE